jgi:Neutral/alkaline non-lysosomal ceramidase, N-terminal
VVGIFPMHKFRSFTLLLVTAPLVNCGLAADNPNLRVGAARVDITPNVRERTPLVGYEDRVATKIHDNIYVRAIVIDNGSERAAIAAVELIDVSEEMWTTASERVAKEAGISPEYLVVAATHTHSAPSPGGFAPSNAQTSAYIARVEDAIVSAVRQAEANLQPARMGIGRGTAYVNVNRDIYTGNGWWLGDNRNGPSDKTVVVIRFDSLAGDPIAFFINYAVHGTVMGPHNTQLSGDLPGATSRSVESHYGSNAVAVWTRGAAGDQNPVYMTWLTTHPERPEDFSLVEALGQILAEEVIRIADNLVKENAATSVTIGGEQKVVSCPGHRFEPAIQPGTAPKFVATDAVNLRLGVLKINDIALVIVNGEVTTPIWERLKQASPYTNIVMVDTANGALSYLTEDEAYDRLTFEVIRTRPQRGCAENAIIRNALEMMAKHR